METIELRFQQLKKEKPLLSSIIIFKRVVDEQKLKPGKLDKDTVVNAFFELVDEKDYSNHQTWDIIDHVLGGSF